MNDVMMGQLFSKEVMPQQLAEEKVNPLSEHNEGFSVLLTALLSSPFQDNENSLSLDDSSYQQEEIHAEWEIFIQAIEGLAEKLEKKWERKLEPSMGTSLPEWEHQFDQLPLLVQEAITKMMKEETSLLDVVSEVSQMKRGGNKTSIVDLPLPTQGKEILSDSIHPTTEGKEILSDNIYSITEGKEIDSDGFLGKTGENMTPTPLPLKLLSLSSIEESMIENKPFEEEESVKEAVKVLTAAGLFVLQEEGVPIEALVRELPLSQQQGFLVSMGGLFPESRTISEALRQISPNPGENTNNSERGNQLHRYINDPPPFFKTVDKKNGRETQRGEIMPAAKELFPKSHSQSPAQLPLSVSTSEGMTTGSKAEQLYIYLGENKTTYRRQQEFIRQFQEIMGRSNLQQLSNGQQQLSIKLFPENLGRLDIQFTHVDGKLAARMIVSSSGARELIESQISQLRLLFQQQNLSVEKIEIAQHPSWDDDKEEKESSSQKDRRDTDQEEKQEEENDPRRQEFADFLEKERINTEI
ncbi:flagellar hook-length control protein FliK [Thalassobacillus sp. C254]|uniref:flagellar hook-length control protein FliK n=1 Tax=Thalassobacillus sp. C254 TaxID=1225341 RepID=UPI0006D071F5|nr:flagellar hook-length control protein FliK [Thalassobacillus sp. C254]